MTEPARLQRQETVNNALVPFAAGNIAANGTNNAVSGCTVARAAQGLYDVTLTSGGTPLAQLSVDPVLAVNTADRSILWDLAASTPAVLRIRVQNALAAAQDADFTFTVTRIR